MAFLEGIVVKQQSGFFTVETAQGLTVCQLRGKLKAEASRRVSRDEEDPTDLCALGDRVTITINEDGSGVIYDIHERERVLSRADQAGGRGSTQQGREQVIIANVDQAVFVLAASHPTPNPRALDRLLVAAEKGQIPSIHIVCNKIDLLDSREDIHAVLSPYDDLGYPVLYTSSVTGEGVDALRAILTGHISVFTGSSGVGKTSLLNAVQPGLGLRVNAVSRATTKGRHTTVHSEMFKLEGGGYVADTPGIRAVGIWDVEPHELEAYYVDIAPHVADCKFPDCTHTHEPGCAVRATVKRGEIALARYKSYLRLRKEIEDTYEDWA
ncbi:MAG: ribosome small subunit-dependent GTPase A [Anaerolineae bacterium]|nr:ribosome small subunit-dependent GTPase A [Anaerolineae bacterium]